MYDSPLLSITIAKEIRGWKITAICPQLLIYANLEVEVMELESQDHRLVEIHLSSSLALLPYPKSSQNISPTIELQISI